ncbi:MAG: hypothetical protein CMM92_06830 [Rickettsiales bacterium]|nr:hypothetical protein [Rickettsiales bacterium]RPG12563.1 MAG: hypothetical protein CBD55_006770 [Pelagibacteraceae bacterium TMED195]|tara:strand:- start:3688 stop:4068 length:381 start_codon:yes stop_codon:yes gene_type:complete
MPLFFLILFLIPIGILSKPLNLICTNNYIDVKSLDVKDLFVVINKDERKIELGGLSFFVDDFKETDSNISWRASDIKIYPETNGDVSGIIGRYSGQLVVNFDRYDNDKRQSLVFNCKKFEPIEKKF